MAKYKNRIYCASHLEYGQDIGITGPTCHYLHSVLRLKTGASLLVFNEHDGEFAAQIIEITKSLVSLRILQQEREPRGKKADITLYYAPVKNPNSSFYVQKATELNANRIVPVITEYTVVRSVNTEKLDVVALEALEQSMRLDKVEIFESMPLSKLAQSIKKHDILLWCDEKADAQQDKLLNFVPKLENFGSIGILIGPEGGFSPNEREMLSKLYNIKSVSLSHNILRAETAMIAVLSVVAMACELHD